MAEMTARFYVSDFGLAVFQPLVGDLLGTRFDQFNSASVKGFGVDAEQNEDYDRRRPEQSPSPDYPDWLFYRWTIWIEAESPEATLADFIALTTGLAKGLRARGADVVIASDFEDEIAAAGG